MRKWPIIVVALLLFGAGVAFFLPRTPSSDDTQADPQTHDSAALPEFHEVAVTGGQTPSPLALTGRVMDQGGKPVPNAKVSLSASAQQDLSTAQCDICERPLLSCENGESWLKIAALLHQNRGVAKGALTTTTDADGKFRFDQLSGVSFTVFAEAEGFGAALHERAAPGDPVELFLPPPRAISGQVRDDYGKPVPNAHVHAVSRRLPINSQVNVTADGSFELRGLGEGPFYVIAEAPGFLPAVSDETEAGPKPVDLRLIRPRTLEVNVRVDGQPVDANVAIEGSHLKRSLPAKKGVARFTDLFPREVSITASSGNRAATPRLVMLQDPVTSITLDLEAGGNISVTVIDEAGQPIPNPEAALLSARGEVLAHQKAETGALIQFGPVASGNYSVQAWAEAYQPVSQPVKVTGAEANVELTLTKGVVIRGKVIDEYERPAPGVSVLVQPTGNAVFADKEGRFVAQVPTAGLYTLHAHHSDWGGGEVQVQAPADDVRLPLEPHGGVEVTVTCEGRRVEGAEAVMYVNKNDVYRSDRSSAADGVVVMRGLPPGSYSLLIRHPDYLSGPVQKLQISEGSMVKASVELEAGVSIVGDVMDEHGSPVAGAYITALPGYRDRPTYADSAGHFEIRALKPNGRYTVVAQHPEYDLVEPARAVAPGKDPVKLSMKKRQVFTGRVIDESGAPIKHFRVDERDVDSPDGRFELPLQSIDTRVIFSVEAAGYEPTTVDKEGEKDLGDITLRKSATLVGSVRDEHGQPVNDAVVTCDLCEQEVMSGADGKFTLARPLTVQELIVTAKKGGLAGNVTVDLSRQMPADVILKPRTHVTGGVYREDGSPAAGEVVEAIGMENADAITFVTGKDGHYATDLPAGHYRFAVGDARMYGPEPVLLVEIGGQNQALDLGPASGTGTLTFKLNPEGGYALWVVRGDVKVDNPMLLNQSSWAEFVYQPQSEVVTLTGFPPGHYTVVWSSFHSMSGQLPQKQITVDVPGKNQFDLTAP